MKWISFHYKEMHHWSCPKVAICLWIRTSIQEEPKPMRQGIETIYRPDPETGHREAYRKKEEARERIGKMKKELRTLGYIVRKK